MTTQLLVQLPTELVTRFRLAVPARSRTSETFNLAKLNALCQRKNPPPCQLFSGAMCTGWRWTPAWVQRCNIALTGGSVARCDQLCTLDKSRLQSKIGKLTSADMRSLSGGSNK